MGCSTRGDDRLPRSGTFPPPHLIAQLCSMQQLSGVQDLLQSRPGDKQHGHVLCLLCADWWPALCGSLQVKRCRPL
jgi:hypothetical protein